MNVRGFVMFILELPDTGGFRVNIQPVFVTKDMAEVVRLFLRAAELNGQEAFAWSSATGDVTPVPEKYRSQYDFAKDHIQVFGKLDAQEVVPEQGEDEEGPILVTIPWQSSGEEGN